VKSWSEFKFLPGSLPALSALAELPLPIVTVTNQAIVNRGLAPASTIEDIHRRMLRQIRRAAGRIDKIYYCPHAAEESCDCRKPEPGLPQARARSAIQGRRGTRSGPRPVDLYR